MQQEPLGFAGGYCSFVLVWFIPTEVIFKRPFSSNRAGLAVLQHLALQKKGSEKRLELQQSVVKCRTMWRKTRALDGAGLPST